MTHTFTPSQKNTHCYLCTMYVSSVNIWYIHLLDVCMSLQAAANSLHTTSFQSVLMVSMCCVSLVRITFSMKDEGQSDTVASPIMSPPARKATIEKETINHSVRWGHAFLVWVTPVGNTILLWTIQVCLYFCNHTKQHYSQLSLSLGLSFWFDTAQWLQKQLFQRTFQKIPKHSLM